MSRASWLRSESVSVSEDEEEVKVPSCGGPEGRLRGGVLVDMGGRWRGGRWEGGVMRGECEGVRGRRGEGEGVSAGDPGLGVRLPGVEG